MRKLIRRLGATLGTVAALTVAPLAVTPAIPAGVLAGPGVAVADPACDADPFSDTCLRHEEWQRKSDRFDEGRDERRKKWDSDFTESHCRMFPKDSICPRADSFPWGKVALGVGGALLLVFVGLRSLSTGSRL